MSQVLGIALFILLIIFGWGTPVGGAGAPARQSHPPTGERALSTSWCLTKCDELEATCVAFEHRFPGCSVNDICLDEKLQCRAECSPTSHWSGPAERSTDFAAALRHFRARVPTGSALGAPIYRASTRLCSIFPTNAKHSARTIFLRSTICASSKRMTSPTRHGGGNSSLSATDRHRSWSALGQSRPRRHVGYRDTRGFSAGAANHARSEAG